MAVIEAHKADDGLVRHAGLAVAIEIDGGMNDLGANSDEIGGVERMRGGQIPKGEVLFFNDAGDLIETVRGFGYRLKGDKAERVT